MKLVEALSMAALSLCLFVTVVATTSDAQAQDQRTWYLQDTTFPDGNTVAGSFAYNSATDEVSNINIDVSDSSGAVLHRFRGHPDDFATIFQLILTEDGIGDDLTDRKTLSFSFASPLSGGLNTIEQTTGIGSCASADCSAVFPGTTTQGQITTSPRATTWFFDGVRAADGTRLRGNFAYTAATDTYGVLAVTVIEPDGTQNFFDATRPFSHSDASFLFVADGAEASGVLLGASNVFAEFDRPLSDSGGTISLTSPSRFGICGDPDCFDNSSSNPIVAGTVTTERQAPTFVSRANVSINENTTAVIDVNTTDNTDSEGSGLEYAALTGVDAALFTIDPSSGVLSFLSPPDFEDPQDANRNNTYVVTAEVLDSSLASAQQELIITVVNVIEAEPVDEFVQHGRPTWETTTDSISVASNESAESVLAAVKANGDLFVRRLSTTGEADWHKQGAGGWSSANVAIDNAGRVEIIALKDDGRLFTRTWSASGEFGPWTRHGAANWDVDAQPSIATNSSLVMFGAVKADGRMFTRVRLVDGPWDPHISHGASGWANIDVAMSPFGQSLVAVKDDGRLFTRANLGFGWSSFESQGAPTWAPDARPSISETNSGTIFLARKADGRLFSRAHLPLRAWESFVQHGRGSWAAGSVDMNESGRVALVGVKESGALYTRVYRSEWGGWTEHGRRTWSVDANPAAAASDTGALFLAVKASGSLYTRSFR